MEPVIARRLLTLQMFRTRAADQVSRRQSHVMATLTGSCWTDLVAGLEVYLFVCVALWRSTYLYSSMTAATLVVSRPTGRSRH